MPSRPFDLGGDETQHMSASEGHHASRAGQGEKQRVPDVARRQADTRDMKNEPACERDANAPEHRQDR
jgi:hypothetical protein